MSHASCQTGRDSAGTYRPRDPEQSLVYRVLQENLETFLAQQQRDGRHVPKFVERELRALGSAAIYDEEVRKTRSGGSSAEEFLHII